MGAGVSVAEGGDTDEVSESESMLVTEGVTNYIKLPQPLQSLIYTNHILHDELVILDKRFSRANVSFSWAKRAFFARSFSS
ncbi:hypothetical protein NL676_018845 [Syzygium grande]|nr:hypothetical protein NL676_018845 [Syzygium grande]